CRLASAKSSQSPVETLTDHTSPRSLRGRIDRLSDLLTELRADMSLSVSRTSDEPPPRQAEGSLRQSTMKPTGAFVELPSDRRETSLSAGVAAAVRIESVMAAMAASLARYCIPCVSLLDAQRMRAGLCRLIQR